MPWALKKIDRDQKVVRWRLNISMQRFIVMTVFYCLKINLNLKKQNLILWLSLTQQIWYSPWKVM